MTNKIATTEASDLIYSEEIETFSHWENNNDQKAVFRLVDDRKVKGTDKMYGVDCQGTHFLHVEVLPGKKVKIPSLYDQAIRTVNHKTGQIVGGLCPWLTKIGEEDIVIHKSLDYKSAMQDIEVKEMAETLKKEDELRAALAVIEKRKVATPVKKK